VEEIKKPRRRIHRWLLLLVILVFGYLSFVVIPPIQPHVQLPAEPLTPPLFEFAGQPFTITNTFVAVVIADIFLIAMALLIRRQIRMGKNALEGVSGVFALGVEGIYNMTEATARKWTKNIFPIFATITLLLVVVNLMELIPGVDSIGLLHRDDHHGYPVQEVIPGVATIIQPEETHTEEHAEDETHEGEPHSDVALYGLYPFVRVTSTDLSFTVALAIIAVVMIQVVGFQALGRSYLKKYLDLSGIRAAVKQPGCSGPLGLIMGLVTSVVVGPLEIVAEISKVISFAFRLFGNIFAGAIVLFVIGSLVPVFVQSIFLLLELGVGLIQALVFGMLTMVFMTMATQAHGGEHH
jgi:F-type H+-transporting ATPase subunit a